MAAFIVSIFSSAAGYKNFGISSGMRRLIRRGFCCNCFSHFLLTIGSNSAILNLTINVKNVSNYVKEAQT